MVQRRRFSRFLPDEPEVVIRGSGGARVSGHVQNESFGGMGLLCERVDGLTVGMPVTLNSEAGELDATIVSIRADEEGIQVGLQFANDDWHREEDADAFDEDEPLDDVANQ